MHLRLFFIITLCSLIYPSPTYTMLASSLKKLNQMQRYKSALSCFDHSDLKQAPYNVAHFLKQMPKKQNFTDIKSMPIVHKIDALSPENKNLMLAHVLNSTNSFSPFGSTTNLKIKAEILMSMVYLIKAGANPDTLINYWHDSPALILAYEAHFYPLAIALELNNIKFIKFLLKHGANVHGPEYKGFFFVEPIFYAQTVEAAKMLFKYGLNLDSKNHDCSELIDSAIRNNKPLELIKLYAKHGANPEYLLDVLEDVRNVILAEKKGLLKPRDITIVPYVLPEINIHNCLKVANVLAQYKEHNTLACEIISFLNTYEDRYIKPMDEAIQEIEEWNTRLRNTLKQKE